MNNIADIKKYFILSNENLIQRSYLNNFLTGNRKLSGFFNETRNLGNLVFKHSKRKISIVYKSFCYLLSFFSIHFQCYY